MAINHEWKPWIGNEAGMFCAMFSGIHEILSSRWGHHAECRANINYSKLTECLAKLNTTWGPFLESPETFRAYFKWHDCLQIQGFYIMKRPASPRWSGDVIRRTGMKNFNAVSHNHARPYFRIQHGKGEVRARRVYLNVHSVTGNVVDTEWSVEFRRWKYCREFGNNT